jgi:hypothetical protein
MGFYFPGNPFGSPNLVVPLVMFGWIPVVLYLFHRFSPRQAVIISFLVAWLFLPEAALPLSGLPNYTKVTATCYGILLATFIFDMNRFQSFRWGWLDIPMLVWCVCPFIASMMNDLGPYDGVTAVISQTVEWGVPYFLGRLYLSDLSGLRQLAMGIFAGGLIYTPLCLFESRASPQLHRLLYGAHAKADFSQTYRFGGFRPTVFMQHGLAVGAFMMAATLIGLWLWHTQTIKQFWNVPIEWLVGALLITFILVRSTGAYNLLVVGVVILLIGKHLRTAIPAFILIIAILAYLYATVGSETHFSSQIISTLSNISDKDRLASLEFRFKNEDILVERARQNLMFGWGGWGRSNLHDAAGNQTTVQDSLWIIAFGQYGLTGLFSLFISMLLPVFSLFWSRCPARLWNRSEVGLTAVLGIIVALYMIDCLLNAMTNPIYILACGGIAGTMLKPIGKPHAAIDRSSTSRRRFAKQQ